MGLPATYAETANGLIYLASQGSVGMKAALGSIAALAASPSGRNFLQWFYFKISTTLSWEGYAMSSKVYYIMSQLYRSSVVAFE
jgi:hypothetical protein